MFFIFYVKGVCKISQECLSKWTNHLQCEPQSFMKLVFPLKSIFFWRILWHTACAGGTLWDGPTTPDIPILLESPPCPIMIGCVTNRIHGRDRCLLGYRRHCSKSRGTGSSDVSATFLPWGHFLGFPDSRLLQGTTENKWLYQWRKCPKIPGFFPGQRTLEMEADWPFFCSCWVVF